MVSCDGETGQRRPDCRFLGVPARADVSRFPFASFRTTHWLTAAEALSGCAGGDWRYGKLLIRTFRRIFETGPRVTQGLRAYSESVITAIRNKK